MITLDIIYGKDYTKRSYASINEFMYWTTSETQAIFNIYKSLQIYVVPSNKPDKSPQVVIKDESLANVLNVFNDIQTSKELIQMDTDKMMTYETFTTDDEKLTQP